jgi:hypothetical protein
MITNKELKVVNLFFKHKKSFAIIERDPPIKKEEKMDAMHIHLNIHNTEAEINIAKKETEIKLEINKIFNQQESN